MAKLRALTLRDGLIIIHAGHIIAFQISNFHFLEFALKCLFNLLKVWTKRSIHGLNLRMDNQSLK